MSRRKKNRYSDTLQEKKTDLAEVAGNAPRKNRRKWCKGKVGVEHVPHLVLSRWRHGDCKWDVKKDNWRWPTFTLSNGTVQTETHYWSCNHETACQNCGKILGMTLNGVGRDCPDFREWTP